MVNSSTQLLTFIYICSISPSATEFGFCLCFVLDFGFVIVFYKVLSICLLNLTYLDFLCVLLSNMCLKWCFICFGYQLFLSFLQFKFMVVLVLCCYQSSKLSSDIFIIGDYLNCSFFGWRLIFYGSIYLSTKRKGVIIIK